MKWISVFLLFLVLSDGEFSEECETGRKKNDFEVASENGEVFWMHGMHGNFQTFVLVSQTYKAKNYSNCFEVKACLMKFWYFKKLSL